MKRKEYVYIAVKLNKNGVPKIIGTFRKEEDANNAAYTGEGWGNVIKQELNKENAMKKFEVGHYYECGDRGFDPIKVLRRTEKSIVVTSNGVHSWRMRIKIDEDGNEYVVDSKTPKSYRDIGVGMYSTKWEIED